ncbi:MAG: PEP-CTERM sorting domain-containing protein [Akkermansiaceae bacterium]
MTDLTNNNVEGTFTVTDGALLTTVQSWATNPADNEGFFISYEAAHNIGVAFGTPTLEITYVPEPSAALLGFLGAGMLLRRRRS